MTNTTNNTTTITRDGLSYVVTDMGNNIVWCNKIGKRGKATKQYRLAKVRDGVIGTLGAWHREI